MEIVTQTLDFITTHWQTIIGFLLAVHGLAVAIVNATPTPADNIWVGKFYRLIEVLAGLFTEKAKHLPGEKQWELSN